jgi:transposase
MDTGRGFWFLGGMSKTFRPWDVDQVWLLPPTVHELVPEGHLAHLVRDTVRETLDLSAILDTYTEERGYPPYHPVMMTALLLYAYCQGVYSSRRIARACEERVDFMAVTAQEKPDFRTVNDFRRRHLKALAGLFVQVLKMCDQAGLVKMGHVTLDGTKIRANASKHKAMSYDRMNEAESRLRAEVERWLKRAEEVDAAEDREFGDRRGDELPDWVANRQARLAKIREAKAALEKEAKQRAAAPKAPEPPRSGSKKKKGAVPDGKVQRNFTDPDSRIMMTSDGFQQCYNAQAVVDAESHVIVACDLTNCAGDARQLEPMVAQIKTNTGRQARELSADAGYCSETNLKILSRRHIQAYVATGRKKHGDIAATRVTRFRRGTRVDAMRIRLRQGGHRSRYRLRKQTAEPVFGQIKAARGFRQFLFRGRERVAQEWSLLCIAHNLLKWSAVAGARG